MKQTVLRIYDFLTSHKRTAFLLLLAVGILCAVSALRMNYDEDISAFLPQGPDSRRYSAVYERLGGQDRMAVFFEGGDLDSRLDAMAAFEEIWAETDTAGLVPGLEARAGDTAVTDVLAFLSANWPYFLTEKDYARADSLLALPGYVPQRMEEDRDALYSPVSSLSSAYFRSDPLGLFSPVLGRLEALNPTGGNHLEDGFLMTPDGQAGVVFFTSPFGGSETGRNGELVNLLETVKAKVMEACPGITVTSTGGPEVAVENARRIKKDSALALLLAAVLICIVLWLSYRRWSDVLWILLSIAAGALFALGIIALFRSSVSIIILGIGSMIIGIAEGDTYVASDVPAILNHTRQVYYIDNLEMGRLVPGEAHFYDLNGDEVNKECVTISFSVFSTAFPFSTTVFLTSISALRTLPLKKSASASTGRRAHAAMISVCRPLT